jgi:hypothetical protein
VGREEFGLVEQHLQHAHELFARGDGEEGLAVAEGPVVGDVAEMAREVGPMLEEPGVAFLNPGSRSITARSSTSTAMSGNSPTSERIRSGSLWVP